MATETEVLGAPPLPAIDVERSASSASRRTVDGRSSLVRVTFVRDHAAGRLPVAAAADVDHVAEVAGPDHDHRRADLAGRPGDVRVRGRDARRLPRAAAGRHDARSWPCVDPGRQESGFIDPADPERRSHHLAGLVARARAAMGVRAAVGQLRRGLDADQLPAPDVQHDRAGRHRRDRHDRLLHAGRLRLRPIPVPGPQPAVPAAAVDDLPAGRRDADPDVHDLRQARVGRDLAAACSCRPSSPTPTTCSCCASTS